MIKYLIQLNQYRHRVNEFKVIVLLHIIHYFTDILTN
jgi:hypothetical protein